MIKYIKIINIISIYEYVRAAAIYRWYLWYTGNYQYYKIFVYRDSVILPLLPKIIHNFIQLKYLSAHGRIGLSENR